MTTEVAMKCEIEKVRLLEDRAFVTRTLRGQYPPGQHRISVPNLTPVLVDKSLSVRVAAGVVEIHDSRVNRRPVVKSQQNSAKVQELRRRIEELDGEWTSLQERLSAVDQTIEMKQSLFATWLRECSEDVVWGRGESETRPAKADSLKQSIRGSVLNRQEIAKELQELSLLRDDLSEQLANLTTPTDGLRAALEIDARVSGEAEIVLEIEYCVPAACWRPYHTARWQGDKLHFSAQACVWQNTGEDWENVALSFSTQRAALGTEPPRLNRDVLRLKKKQKTVVVETREESVQVLEKTVETVPGIDDGGETLNLSAPHRGSIHSDGRPHRVELFDFETDAVREMKVLAEMSPCLFLNSRQSNRSSKPLLSGPVDLVKGSGLVGRAQVEFVSPGQEFVLSWGPDPSVRVHREHREGKQDSSFASSWLNKTHYVELHLSNLGTQAKSFEVTERIPVSELKYVKVEQDLEKTSPRAKADENGFVHWNVALEGRGRETLKLEYTVSRKKQVEGEL